LPAVRVRRGVGMKIVILFNSSLKCSLTYLQFASAPC
jgi:hypothetical protein